jgi:hypothetical protein
MLASYFKLVDLSHRRLASTVDIHTYMHIYIYVCVCVCVCIHVCLHSSIPEANKKYNVLKLLNDL